MFTYFSEETRTNIGSDGKDSVTSKVHVKNGKGYKEVVSVNPRGKKHRSKHPLSATELACIEKKEFLPGLFLTNVREIREKKMGRKTRSKAKPNPRKRSRKQKGGGLALPTDSGLAATPKGEMNLQVMFGRATASQNITDLSFNSVQIVPTVSWMKAAAPLTFICWDPDAISTIADAVYLHWVVTSISGTSPDSGTTVLEWTPPNPPAGTGSHRYFFGVFSGDSSQLAGLTQDQRVGFQLVSNIRNLTLLDWVAVKVQSPTMVKVE